MVRFVIGYRRNLRRPGPGDKRPRDRVWRRGPLDVLKVTAGPRLVICGVRMALGARSGHIVRLVVAQGLGHAAAGSAIGLVIAGLASRWIEPLLYQESPWDPVTSGAVAAVMIAVGIVAGAVPAARALRADPNRALRVE